MRACARVRQCHDNSKSNRSLRGATRSAPSRPPTSEDDGSDDDGDVSEDDAAADARRRAAAAARAAHAQWVHPTSDALTLLNLTAAYTGVTGDAAQWCADNFIRHKVCVRVCVLVCVFDGLWVCCSPLRSTAVVGLFIIRLDVSCVRLCVCV